MSTIFFEVEELAAVGRTMAHVSAQYCSPETVRTTEENAAQALADYSKANAKAFRVRYEGRHGGAKAHAKSTILAAMRKGPAGGRIASSTIGLMRYNLDDCATVGALECVCWALEVQASQLEKCNAQRGAA